MSLLSMSSLSIKTVELPDLDAAVALFDAQLREHDIITPVADLRDVAHAVIGDSSHGFLLLALSKDTPVGVAYAASHLSLEHGGMIGWLEELYVTPRWRGSGIGGRILTEVIARAQKLNWRGLELEVVAGHERVVPLYLRHAFQPLSRNRFCRIFSNE
jgi:GNAT superfamily N-acetyltransferase